MPSRADIYSDMQNAAVFPCSGFIKKEIIFMKTDWLNRGMRVMQYNLQIRDTLGMNPVKIAKETEKSASNAVVINVGGIYAWYRSKVPYHHINEYLPEGRDLLQELIDEFHKRDIKVIARFDFSLADDRTYLEHPEWFTRDKDMNPVIPGATRMGGWDQLLSTCALSGYRNEEVAAPILEEVLDNYAIDGIFLNAPVASFCHCEHCRKVYLEKYGKPMPDTQEELEPGWLSDCTKQNIDVLYKAIKGKNKDIPLILYYSPFTETVRGFGTFMRDSIYDRFATADYICCEAQDVLSAGAPFVPFTEKPSLTMKAGFEPESGKRPFGIIHSCPGMDWRHVGLPKAEYLPWMAQIPASNGVLWHSVTGYPDTIYDKNVMESASEINHMALKTEPDMEKAASYADVIVLWDGTYHSRDIGCLLMKNHIPFDIMPDFRMNRERLSGYPVAVIPAGFMSHAGDEAAAIIREYAENGGHVVWEELDADVLASFSDILGIEKETKLSEYLAAAYMRFDDAAVGEGTGCDRMAFRGSMRYCRLAGGRALATLIPPFAPLDVVGRPPERASIPVQHTNIPMVIENKCGKGSIVLLPYSLDELAAKYHMIQHVQFFGNLVKMAGGRIIETDAPCDVQTTTYVTDASVLVHLVNEVGARPLLDTVAVHGIKLKVRIPGGCKVSKVRKVISGGELEFSMDGEFVSVVIPSLGVWEMLAVDLK